MPIPKKGETQEDFVKRCIPIVIAEGTAKEYKQATAVCISLYNDTQENSRIDSKKHIAFDKAVLQDKIVTDNDDILTIPAVIASEIVQQYDDGLAYKPARELEKMAEIAQLIGSVPVKILEHPGADTNYLLLKHGDVNGKADNFRFTKSLPDPTTKRPMRRGVIADLTWFKQYTPQDTIDKMVDGDLRDVSIGFTYDKDPSPGKHNGQDYNYIQRNIFLNHVAAPIPRGRCPGPICGIGFDANLKFGVDQKQLNDCPVCRTIVSVGLLEASKNLYINYGADVLRVIQGEIVSKPKPVAKPVVDTKEDLSIEFQKAFGELDENLTSRS